MNVFWIKFIFGSIFLLLASWKDFKSREVWDWLSFSFISFGFLLNLFLSLYYSTFFYIVSSLLGFVVAYILSLMLFYLGQWGGGDAKLLMGVGSLLGLNLSMNFREHVYFLFGFVLSLILTAWLYALVLILSIYFKNKNYFNNKSKSLFKKPDKKLIIFMSSLLILFFIIISYMSFSTGDFTFLVLNFVIVFLFFLMYYVMKFLKVIEHFGFIKSRKVKELTPGDWVVDDITIKNPKLSFFEYEYTLKYNHFKDVTYLYKLFFSIFRPKKKLEEHLKQKLRKKLLKKMKTTEEKWLDVKKSSKNMPESVLVFMKSEGFLIKSQEIVVCSNKSLGLLSSQIDFLKKHLGHDFNVRVKEGIPFVPAFLIAFLFQFLVLKRILAYLLIL